MFCHRQSRYYSSSVWCQRETLTQNKEPWRHGSTCWPRNRRGCDVSCAACLRALPPSCVRALCSLFDKFYCLVNTTWLQCTEAESIGASNGWRTLQHLSSYIAVFIRTKCTWKIEKSRLFISALFSTEFYVLWIISAWILTILSEIWYRIVILSERG